MCDSGTNFLFAFSRCEINPVCKIRFFLVPLQIISSRHIIFVRVLASLRLSSIACVESCEFTICLFSLTIASLSEKNVRLFLIVSSSKRRRNSWRSAYSGLSTSENCLTKFGFVFLFGFLFDKREQENVEAL